MKALILHAILLSLVLSVMMPSCLSLMDVNNDSKWALDAADEENNPQEIEKEISEKELINQSFASYFIAASLDRNPTSTYYLLARFEGKQQLLLRPPERV